VSLGASGERVDPFGGLSRAEAFRLLGRAAGRLRAGLRCASGRNPSRVAAGQHTQILRGRCCPLQGGVSR